VTKTERIMARVRAATLKMAPLLGLSDWQFRFQAGTSEDRRAAEVQEDCWNRRATIYWNVEDPGYKDEDFFFIKVIHELAHCVFCGPSTIHQNFKVGTAETEECESNASCFSFASEEAVSSLARALWYRLIKPLWGSGKFGEYPQEWGAEVVVINKTKKVSDKNGC
jgi:hypothetical protein